MHPGEMQTQVQQKNVHSAYSSIIYHGQKVETAQTSIHSWMDKQNELHPYNGIWLGHKKSNKYATA